MKTAISIPDELFRAADRMAQRLGVSRSELYQRAVAAFLARHADQAVTDALNAIYPDEQSSVDSSLMRAQFLSLDRNDW